MIQKAIVLASILFFSMFQIAHCQETPKDTEDQTKLISELDTYWKKLAKTVAEGDVKGYAAAYHPDAILVASHRENKKTMPIATAIEGWKKGFMDTKAGINADKVEFRFSQRIINENTAHETGIFNFTSAKADGSESKDFIIHFEMLLVKKNGVWLSMMEHQKGYATVEDWEALE